jgi:hypothetical protein
MTDLVACGVAYRSTSDEIHWQTFEAGSFFGLSRIKLVTSLLSWGPACAFLPSSAAKNVTSIG